MHIGIEEPVRQRKDVLNIAIDVIQALKTFEIHRKANREKAIYRKHFARIVKELNLTIHEFKETIPEAHIPPQKKEEEEIVPSEKPEIKIIRRPIRKKSELDKLEDDVSALKAKISSL